jgi:cellulose synthase/poly-beta-1,6-N-acetylglucosamine synthase-like glycosyltransferase
MHWFDILLASVAVPVLLAAGYLACLALLAKPGVPPAPAADVRFDVVVPAHNEEAGIADTLASLHAVDYPRERFRVVVVADNCTDRTRDRAEAAGARVLLRDDPGRRGKGWALSFAFERLLAEGWADAFLVVDADSVVTANLLAACAGRLPAGAQALQARYAVRDHERSWRTRLLHLALTLFHDIRSEARERLRLSCGLRGNGMAFSSRLLREVPHAAFSLTEDLEYGVRLGLAGRRVGYVGEASVFGEMAATESASRTQRRRWEAGRLLLARELLPPLLREAWRSRSPMLADLALDLLVPPLGYLALAAVLGLLASLLGIALGFGTLLAAAVWGLAVLSLLTYVARGFARSGLGSRGLLDLLRVPGFVAWKVLLWLRPDRRWRGEWVRTPREGRAP